MQDYEIRQETFSSGDYSFQDELTTSSPREEVTEVSYIPRYVFTATSGGAVPSLVRLNRQLGGDVSEPTSDTSGTTK